jgi:hypothetical protein
MQYVTWVTHPGGSRNPTRYVTEAVDSPVMDRKVSILRKAGVPLTVWEVELSTYPFSYYPIPKVWEDTFVS